MESTKDRNYLIDRYLEDKCTPEEKNELFKLLSSHENEKSFKEILFSKINEINDNQNAIDAADSDRIYNKLISEIERREKRESERRLLQKRENIRKFVFGGISIAAVFCLAFFLGAVFNNNTDVSGPMAPLANTYSEIKAPLGARSEIKLSDGTEVILNAGSSLKYRSDFNSLNRDLILEGEGYFKVAKNTNLPLVVSAGNIKIKATGTEFNVKAYSDEGIIETTLVEGKVEITQKGNNRQDDILLLEPNQKAIYASKSDQLTLEKIKEIEPMAVKAVKMNTDRLMVSQKTDVEQVTAWTKNKLIIRSENLESLCTKLQRKYNVNFVFMDEEIKKERFSGTLKDETFEQVMDIIKLTAPVSYILDGKKVIMSLNNEEAGKYKINPKMVKPKNDTVKN
jgi:transmembrane sensor